MSNPNNTLKGKRIVRTTSRAVDNIVLLTLLVILMLACYAFWDTHQVYAAAEASHYSTYKPTEETTQSFEELRAINSDVIGWITVYDTRIDYPVLHSENPSEDYLSRNVMKEWQGSGSLFIDHNNKSDFSDFNTVIFGHHMSEHAMFGDIDLFLKKDFFDKHEYANLYFSDTGFELVQTNNTDPNGQSPSGLSYQFTSFNGRNHGLQFFAIILADGYDTGVYGVPSTTEEAKENTLKTIADKAIFVRNLSTGETKEVGQTNGSTLTKTGTVDPSFFGVNTSDRIVLLSTCSADITNGRFVLVGKLLDYEVPNPFPEEEQTESQVSLDVFSVLEKFQNLAVWQWTLMLLALILIVSLLYVAEKKRLKRKRDRKLRKEAQNTQ